MNNIWLRSDYKKEENTSVIYLAQLNPYLLEQVESIMREANLCLHAEYIARKKGEIVYLSLVFARDERLFYITWSINTFPDGSVALNVKGISSSVEFYRWFVSISCINLAICMDNHSPIEQASAHTRDLLF